jgi:hypothetical protein
LLFGFFPAKICGSNAAVHAACGLYFVAELAEEHPSKFKKFLHYSFAVRVCCLCAAWLELMRLTRGECYEQAVLACHVILLLDGVPFFEILVGIACHLCYGFMMRKFPFIELTSTPCLFALSEFAVIAVIVFLRVRLEMIADALAVGGWAAVSLSVCAVAVAVVVDHYIWFMYFGKHRDPALQVMVSRR